MVTLHLVVRGKVQGVFFRASAKEAADDLGLTGWVRNTEEGAVEVRVSGPEEKVRQFTEWCRQGPPRAKVTEVTVAQVPDENFESFRVVR